MSLRQMVLFKLLIIDTPWDMIDIGSLGDLDLDENRLPSLDHEIVDTGSKGSEFFDQIMNDPTFFEDLEFISDDEDKLAGHVKSVGDTAKKSRKRIHEITERSDLPLHDGIYLYIISRA